MHKSKCISAIFLINFFSLFKYLYLNANNLNLHRH